MASNARHKMIEEMKKYKSKISSEAIESLAEDIIELLGGISAILDLYLYVKFIITRAFAAYIFITFRV